MHKRRLPALGLALCLSRLSPAFAAAAKTFVVEIDLARYAERASMTQSSWLWDLVAWLSLPLLAILAGGMVGTKRYKSFPLFFGYVLVACLVGVIRFVIYKNFSQRIYFYSYWASDSIIVVSSFLAIYETFVQRTFPQFFKVRLYRYLFPGIAVIAVLLAFLTALTSPNKAAAFFITSRVFDFLRTSLIGFFVLLALLMGRRFARQEFSIALGFGLQAAFTFLNAALTTRTGYKANVLARFEPLVYDVACVMWLWSFLFQPAPADPEASDEFQTELLQQARAWETVLKNWLSPKKRVL